MKIVAPACCSSAEKLPREPNAGWASQKIDDQDDEAAECRQRAHLAAADALDIGAEVVAQAALGDRLSGCGSHGDARARSVSVELLDRPGASQVIAHDDSSVLEVHRVAAVDVRGLAGGDQLDQRLLVDVFALHDGGDLAQIHGGDAVRDLQHVDHVVRDQQHGDALVGEPADQVEHLRRLRHTERGRGLVEQHDLGVPQHGLRDRDGLALPAGQAGHALANRLHRAHRQRVERLAGGLLHGDLVEQDAAVPFPAEEHVLHDVEVVAQGEVLIDDLDAERGTSRAGCARAPVRPRRGTSPESMV